MVLCILCAIPADLKSKILQHFMEKEPWVQDLKFYANNLLAADHKIGGDVKIVFKGSKSKNLT